MKNATHKICFSAGVQLSIHALDRLQRQQDFAFRNNNKFAELPPREIEVLTLICKGFTNEEIANYLFRSVHTVRTHRNRIWRQLGIKSLVEAIWWGQSFELV